MKSSSVAPRLKQERQDDCKFQEGDVNSLELRLGISSDNGQISGGGAASPWLGVGVHPWSLAARQGKAALEQAHQRPNECAVQRFGYHLQSNSFFLEISAMKTLC